MMQNQKLFFLCHLAMASIGYCCYDRKIRNYVWMGFLKHPVYIRRISSTTDGSVALQTFAPSGSKTEN
jgi:hypothetical protein